MYVQRQSTVQCNIRTGSTRAYRHATAALLPRQQLHQSHAQEDMSLFTHPPSSRPPEAESTTRAAAADTSIPRCAAIAGLGACTRATGSSKGPPPKQRRLSATRASRRWASRRLPACWHQHAPRTYMVHVGVPLAALAQGNVCCGGRAVDSPQPRREQNRSVS